MKIHGNYLVAAILLFATEVAIALFVHDNFIRPYVGDVLVVMLIYCFVKSFNDTPVLPTALFVLLFAFIVELMQFYNAVERLGLQHSKLARTVIGTSFSWLDLITYTIGIIIILVIERFRGAIKPIKKPSVEG